MNIPLTLNWTENLLVPSPDTLFFFDNANWEYITIHSQTGEYGSRIGIIKQWITDSDGNLCSTTEMKIGLFDTHKRKLAEPTPEWLTAIK